MIQERLYQISNNIYQNVISIHNEHNQNFDIERYDRITYYVVNSLECLEITPVEKLALYYASLLYPLSSLDFYSYGLTGSILDQIEMLDFIESKDDFIALIIDIIEYKYLKSNVSDWRQILQDCINLDLSHPKSLYLKALELCQHNIPLYHSHTPYIKTKEAMKGLCHRGKKYNSFMTYLYHTGLYVGDKIVSNNKYIKSQSQAHREKIIDLILLYGNQEYLTAKDLKNWSE